MSDVKKLSDVLKAAPILAELGTGAVLVTDLEGALGKMNKADLTKLDGEVLSTGAWIAQKCGVYLLVAFSKDRPGSEYFVGILINRKTDKLGMQHMIPVVSKNLTAEYNQWGTVQVKGGTSDTAFAIIRLMSTPELMGGVSD